MAEDMEDSPVAYGFSAAWIEEGVITRVHPSRYTVDWEADKSSRRFFDICLASPYVHQGYGQGMTIMPEVGAKCLVVQPSDDSPPVVLAFVVDPVNTTDKDGEISTSYHSARPPAVPGDIIFRGRKGNTVYLHRNGNLQLGASPGNQTFYLPISSLLWDVCKRYRLDTGGGQLAWEVASSATYDTELRLTARERATAANASLSLRMGTLADLPPPPTPGATTVLFELAIAPEGVDNQGRSAAQVFALRVDKAGHEWRYNAGSVTTAVGQDTVYQCVNRTETISGNQTTVVGGMLTETIIGMRDSTALRQTVRAMTEVLLEAPLIRYGGLPASLPGVYGPALLTWLAKHTHPAPGTPPKEVDDLASILAARHLYI